ncbi:hypothetical protein [Isoptericola aurantiacus]|uniref:hypothetical protein n=1 Tax=Isoptericola aurantiacus TaxID=3377839 RepID=UPI00383A2BC2
MGAVTRVDAVVARLIKIFGTATGLQVEDGPSIGEVMFEAIVVGMPSGSSDPGYTTKATRLPGLGPARYREDSTVRSMLTVTSGNTVAAEVRNACAGYLRTIDAALRSDQVVEDVWQRVELDGDMDWVVIQHEDGVTCTVFFSVSAESLL